MGEWECFIIFSLNLSVLISLCLGAITFTSVYPVKYLFCPPLSSLPIPFLGYSVLIYFLVALPLLTMLLLGEIGSPEVVGVGGMLSPHWDTALGKSFPLESRHLLWSMLWVYFKIITFPLHLPEPRGNLSSIFIVRMWRGSWR